MSLKEKRAEAAKQAAEYQTRIKAGETLTEEELTDVKGLLAEIEELDGKIAEAVEKSALLERLGGLETDVKEPVAPQAKAKSLGEHFVKSLKEAGVELKRGVRFEAPEFKANTDISQVGVKPDEGWGPLVTQLDREAVFPYARELMIADLIPSGTLSGSMIKYPVYGPVEGNAATVAEGGLKPQVHFPEPTFVTEGLSEIAAWTGISDAMADDLPYVVAQINQQLVRMLLVAEEDQILKGDGSGSNLTGILNRNSILTQEGTDLVEEIAKAKANIRKATSGMWQPDAVVLNPDDYTSLILRKDGNGQFYGGGFFQNAYGNGTYEANLPIWGLRVVQSEAIDKGTALVGAFKSALLFRKGGVMVASTDSHDDWFVKDQIAIRAKTRVGLEVKYPAAFSKITVAGA